MVSKYKGYWKLEHIRGDTRWVEYFYVYNNEEWYYFCHRDQKWKCAGNIPSLYLGQTWCWFKDINRNCSPFRVAPLEVIIILGKSYEGEKNRRKHNEARKIQKRNKTKR